jgi:hypothetical protein
MSFTRIAMCAVPLRAGDVVVAAAGAGAGAGAGAVWANAERPAMRTSKAAKRRAVRLGGKLRVILKQVLSALDLSKFIQLKDSRRMQLECQAGI